AHRAEAAERRREQPEEAHQEAAQREAAQRKARPARDRDPMATSPQPAAQEAAEPREAEPAAEERRAEARSLERRSWPLAGAAAQGAAGGASGEERRGEGAADPPSEVQSPEEERGQEPDDPGNQGPARRHEAASAGSPARQLQGGAGGLVGGDEPKEPGLPPCHGRVDEPGLDGDDVHPVPRAAVAQRLEVRRKSSLRRAVAGIATAPAIAGD